LFFLFFLPFFAVVFGQGSQDGTAQRAQHTVTSRLVARVRPRGTAGHRAEQAAVLCAVWVHLSWLLGVVVVWIGITGAGLGLVVGVGLLVLIAVALVAIVAVVGLGLSEA